MNNDVKTLQAKLLEMAKYLHNFCVEHGIKYYMIGGTMLGAVRHKGFIPWDDDMDFGMLREDYDKLLSLKNELSVDYTLNDHISDKNFKYGFCKMYDENTTYIESVLDTDYVGGVYIDIFPLDNAGNDLEKAKKLHKKIKWRRRLRSILYTKGERKSKIKDVLVKVGQAILPESNKWFEWPYDVLKKYKGDDSRYLMNVYGAGYEKEIVEKDVFGEPKLYEFEDTQFYGVADYDKYLTSLYGDYMTPPPDDKRKKHSISFVDYNMPYKQYKEVKGKSDGTIKNK